MATVIHHGAPGSYKSFTLVQRFAIPALKEGRVVVTNIRGFDNPANIADAFPDFDFPDTARLIFVDCTTQAGRDRMARWFHWVPIGAQIFIDELQEIYPARADFKMTDLDIYTPIHGEVIEATAESRPRDVFVAFDKQRHYNWNLYGSTTNIAKVKKEIRQVAEWAYRHRDTSGLLPWKKNTWMEHQHDPETSGKSASHRVGEPVDYKADPRIFKCYSSTATGSHEASKAGRSILSDPKIRTILFILFCAVSYLIYAGFNYLNPSVKSPVSSVVQPVVKAPELPKTSTVPPVNNANNSPPAVIPSKDSIVDTPKALTRDLIIKWSIKMLEDDLFNVPTDCKIRYPRVTCDIEYKREFMDVARNYTCERMSSGIDVCTLIFFIARQMDDTQKQKPLLNMTALN